MLFTPEEIFALLVAVGVLGFQVPLGFFEQGRIPDVLVLVEIVRFATTECSKPCLVFLQVLDIFFSLPYRETRVVTPRVWSESPQICDESEAVQEILNSAATALETGPVQTTPAWLPKQRGRWGVLTRIIFTVINLCEHHTMPFREFICRIHRRRHHSGRLELP